MGFAFFVNKKRNISSDIFVDAICAISQQRVYFLKMGCKEINKKIGYAVTFDNN